MSLVVRYGHSEESRWGRPKMGGFSARVQRNLALDFVTRQHKSLQKLEPVYSQNRCKGGIVFPQLIKNGWHVYGYEHRSLGLKIKG